MFRFLLFLGGVMMAGTSMAESVSKCPVDSVPIQLASHGEVFPETTLSAAKLSGFARLPIGDYPYFPAFVTTVTEHIVAKLAEDKLCLSSAKSKEHSNLQFVHWLFFSPDDKPLVPAPPLNVRPTNGCWVSSPWIDIAIERKPIPWVRAVIRFNERQLITDQAILAGAYNMPSGIAIPLMATKYRSFVYEFKRSLDGSKATTKRIEERIPPDLLWLFRRFQLSGFLGGDMDQVLQKGGAEGYTKLVIKMIDRCFASKGTGDHYNSIYDVGDWFFLEQYMINMPVQVVPRHSVRWQHHHH